MGISWLILHWWKTHFWAEEGILRFSSAVEPHKNQTVKPCFHYMVRLESLLVPDTFLDFIFHCSTTSTSAGILSKIRQTQRSTSETLPMGNEAMCRTEQNHIAHAASRRHSKWIQGGRATRQKKTGKFGEILHQRRQDDFLLYHLVSAFSFRVESSWAVPCSGNEA